MSATSRDGIPYVDLGTSDNVAWDQPRVAVELVTGEQVNVTPASVVFMPDNNDWATPRTLTVSAIDDHVLEGAHSTTIKHRATSQDGNFNGTAIRSLTVQIADNDSPPGTTSSCALPPASPGNSGLVSIIEIAGGTQVAEGGATDTYTVVLTSRPAYPVEISVYFFDVNEDQRCSVGPPLFNHWLLDTGANSVMAFQTAVDDMDDAPHIYATEGRYEEFGVAGPQFFDISEPYRFDFAGTSGQRHMLRDTRILSDPNNNLSIVGPYGIVGMPAMAGRITTLDYTVWETIEGLELYMGTDFADEVPEDTGHRYSVAVDNRVSFSPEGHVLSGQYPPVWADIPFFTVFPMHNGVAAEGNALFDTGAQVSVFTEQMGFKIGLDSNRDGKLDENDANFARYETVGGIGGTITAPVFLFDEVHVPTQQGVDLVWTDLQWLVLDIYTGVESLTVHIADSGGTPGFSEDCVPAVPDPNSPGVRFDVTGGCTQVVEGGATDTYTVVLTRQPASPVEVTVRPEEGQLTVSPQTLLFTPDNWNSPQTVTVTAVDDQVAEGPHTATIKHWVASQDPAYRLGIDIVFGSDLLTSGWIEAFAVNGQSGWIDQIQLDFRDMPTAGTGVIHFDLNELVDNLIDPNGPGARIMESGGSTTVSEGDAADPYHHDDTYQIVLTQQPAKNVRVALTNRDGELTAVEELSGNPWVDFTPVNWMIPQTVVVSAVDDSDEESFHRSSIYHVSTSEDPNYNGVGMPRVIVNIIDDDMAGVMIIPSDGSTDVVEGGATDSYQVVLTKAPVQEVTIDLEHRAGQVTAANANPPGGTSLTFTSANWNVPRTVQVSAVDDGLKEGTHKAYITHRVSTADVDYQLVFALQELVTIVDNDTAPTVESLVVGDGTASRSVVRQLAIAFDSQVSIDAGAFTVNKRDAGGGAVGVDVASSTAGGKTVATLTFTGAFTEASGSLVDGNYDLTIDAAKVRDGAGNLLDGDGNGTPGGDFVFGQQAADNFFRLYGDADGDGDCDVTDMFGQFMPSFGTLVGDAAYRADLDWDGDGDIDVTDLFGHFMPSFGNLRDTSGYSSHRPAGNDERLLSAGPSDAIVDGQASSAALDIGAVDDAVVDGTQAVTTTATGAAYEAGSDKPDVMGSESWQNPFNYLDVQDDGSVAPADVLYVINELNNRVYSDAETGKLRARGHHPGASYFDVDGNDHATPADALPIINHLNRGAEGEGEGSQMGVQSVPSPPRSDQPVVRGISIGLPRSLVRGIAGIITTPYGPRAPHQRSPVETSDAATLGGRSKELALSYEHAMRRQSGIEADRHGRCGTARIPSPLPTESGDPLNDELESATAEIAEDISKTWRGWGTR